MRKINRYSETDLEGTLEPDSLGKWCKWVDVIDAFKAQLPAGMEDCIIQFKECAICQKSWLTAANWIDHGCPHCEREKLQKELQEVRALALAAVQLIPEDENFSGLRTLAKEAREVFMGKDKETIAKLQDELRYAQEYSQRIQRPPTPGVNWVFGVKLGDNTQCRYSLMITSLSRAANGGLEIGVQLP